MIGDKKIIGICITQINSTSSVELINGLNRRALARGYKLIVFNSPLDLSWNSENEKGLSAVFESINFDIVDVLLIEYLTFRSDEMIASLVKKAKAHGTPVIILNGRSSGCHCVTDEYTESYKALMDHVIKEHGVRDTLYMAGREGFEESEERIAMYKAVLEENGLPYSRELVGFGFYWDKAAGPELRRMIERHGRVPEAVFCANDYMAFGVCRELQLMGYKVPDDVIVTGFDGVPEAEFFDPILSTCRKDYDDLARQAIKAADMALGGADEPFELHCSYRTRTARSCGCHESDNFGIKIAAQQFTAVHAANEHDKFVYGLFGKTMNVSDLSTFTSLLPEWIIEDSFVCLNSDFVAQALEDDISERIADKLEIIPSIHNAHEADRRYFLLSEMLPETKLWLNDESVYVLDTLSSGSEVYGIYAVKSLDILSDSYKIDRTVKYLNICIRAIVNSYRQRSMIRKLRTAAMTDHLTGLPNLHGTTKWFEDFSADPKTHEGCISVSVYVLSVYKYIYENFGIEELENTLCVIAEGLKHANPENCFIGHVAEDEFIVINYYDSQEQIAPTIDAAVAEFYGIMGSYKERRDIGFDIEVNCGCTEGFKGWTGTLSEFSRLASNEMYLNRLKYANSSQPESKVKVSEQNLKAFELLIERNLLEYHFQPIVDVESGEIFAYEALMRPDKSIGLNPAQVVETASEFDRLYDVQKATMFNAMKTFRNKLGQFQGRRIFINSIPGYFLTSSDYGRFVERFSDLLKYVVIELIESSTVKEKELASIRGLMNGSTPVAIDDYGTGHSNIVNLMRYSPQIIKIDRYLITEIQNDRNKQMFFRSTVEYARMNGIKVLAEGVETADELKCVIELGADLIQGYYTGKASAEPLEDIPEHIKNEIKEAKINKK